MSEGNRKGKDRAIQKLRAELADLRTENTELDKAVGRFIDQVRRMEDELAALRRRNERLETQVTHDELTGLYNRRGLYERMAVDIHRLTPAGAKPRQGSLQHIAILFVDVDHFKEVNTKYGQEGGDRALVAIAEHFRSGIILDEHSLRVDTDVVARYGGEEFVIELPGTSLESAATLLSEGSGGKLRLRPCPVDMGKGDKITITFSAGLTAYRYGEDKEIAIDRAGKGMGRAKAHGRNQVLIEE